MTLPPPPWDALFVINQKVDPAAIGALSRARGFRQVVITTTHQVLANERPQYKAIAPAVDIHSFADLLNDSQLQACDDRATAELAPRLSRNGIRADYIRCFIDRSLWHKNQAIYRKIMRRYAPRRLYFGRGLGIHTGFWQNRKATALASPGTDPVRQKLQKWRRRMQIALAPKYVHRVCAENVCYFFLSDIKRLPLKKQIAETDRIPVSTIRWLLAHSIPACASRWIADIMHRHGPAGHRPVLATTVHGYHALPGAKSWPLRIFIDGYHPPNYSRSYLDVYPPRAVFVSPDRLNRVWFHSHGLKTEPAPAVFEPSPMLPASAIDPALRPTVILVLNHAGDWSALVNRSDTDRLVEAFSKTAALLPQIDFVVRPHPTMVLPEHEGSGSLERIRTYIARRNLKNLSLSALSLDADLGRGTLFVSEYSQVLIDAWRSGKLGIAANLTGRRSFMQVYQDMGFCSVDSAEALTQAIETTAANPSVAASCQNKAVNRHNRLMASEQTNKG